MCGLRHSREIVALPLFAQRNDVGVSLQRGNRSRSVSRRSYVGEHPCLSGVFAGERIVLIVTAIPQRTVVVVTWSPQLTAVDALLQGLRPAASTQLEDRGDTVVQEEFALVPGIVHVRINQAGDDILSGCI